MSMQYLDLGRAAFVSTKASAQIKINASAVLYCESEKHLEVRPSEVQGHTAICEDIWIYKSHDFGLSFVISSDHDPIGSTSTENDHLEDIEDKLEIAQLWKQLGLLPSLLSQTSSTSRSFESSRRQFALALRDDHGEQFRNQGQGADLANLRPPEGVKTIRLISVLISLHFGASVRENHEVISAANSQIQAASFAPSIANDLQDHEITIEESPQDLESSLENDDLGPWSLNMDADWPSKSATNTRRSKRRSSSMAILPLADIAIRSLICAKPTRTPAAIHSREDSRLLTLANLAPAVFIPGYRDEVQSRAKLVPTIAKFLCQFLRHSESKTHSAHHNQDGIFDNVELSSEEDFQEQKDKIKQDLWMTLTNGVKYVELARKLKPLHIARTGESQVPSPKRFEDLLDSWRPSEDDTVFPLEDDFEDLHLDEEQDFAEYEDEYFSDLYDECLSTFDSVTLDVTDATTANFNNGFSQVLSSSPIPDCMLDTSLNPDCSPIDRACICERSSVITCRRSRTGGGCQTIPDSSDSQLRQVTETCIVLNQPDMIGEAGSSHVHVSRKLPSHAFGVECSDSSRAEALLLEETEFHVAPSILPFHEQSTLAKTEGIVSVVNNQDQMLFDISDQKTNMYSNEKTNRSSLTDTLGGDQLLWQMWTRRRPSMIQTDDDMLEMHTMYAQDPDMRLLDTHEELDDNDVKYVLDSEPSNLSSADSTSSMNIQPGFMLPYGPSPVAERQHHHPFHLRKELSPRSPQRDESRPTPRRRLSRGQNFIKRLSGAKASVEETPSPSRPFSRDEPRTVEIKRRKTLADYDKSSDSDEMLLR